MLDSRGIFALEFTAPENNRKILGVISVLLASFVELLPEPNRWMLEGNSPHSENCPYLTRQSFGHFYLVKVPFRPEKVSTFSGVDR